MTIAYKAKKKGAQNERLDNRWWYMLIVGNHHLLADAKMLKDILKHHIIRNFTSYVRNKEDTLSYVCLLYTSDAADE